MKELLALAGVGASIAVFRWCKSQSSAPEDESSAPEVLVTDGGFEMVHVEAGEFEMGCVGCARDERPMHTVILTQSFYIAKYAVTFEQYNAYCEETGRLLVDGNRWAQDNVPVFGLSWYDAVEYCNWLSEKEGLTPCYGEGDLRPSWVQEADGYRLPTEAEWAYAAKGGALGKAQYVYPGSDDADEVAWYADNSDGRPQPVGGKMPNELGLYDMSGNVREFCWDRYAWNFYLYCGDPVVDPRGANPTQHPNIVLRGGDCMSWKRAATTCPPTGGCMGSGWRGMEREWKASDRL
jgi:formylglycine-generating enzyme required for sulfatase activity